MVVLNNFKVTEHDLKAERTRVGSAAAKPP